MKLYRFVQQQQLSIGLDEAWSFFSNPANLSKLMPPEMAFEVISGADEPAYAGQIIRYRIAPVANIPMTWVTEITQCQHKHYFVDEQRFGPYSFWQHLHRFTENAEGVLIEDILHYGLPMGWLGRLVAGGFVQGKINEIFSQRTVQLQKLFPNISNTPSSS